MPPINLSMKHGRTLEEARRHLETAVHKVHNQFRALVRQVAWSADNNRARLDGIGFWVEMWVDAQEVHASGHIPLLGQMLGSLVATGLKQSIQQTFQKKLTQGSGAEGWVEAGLSAFVLRWRLSTRSIRVPKLRRTPQPIACTSNSRSFRRPRRAWCCCHAAG